MSAPRATATPAIGLDAELALKTTPPRAARDRVVRARLASDAPAFADRPIVVVQAPAGFGKTSLLAQWRLEHLARGVRVVWLGAQPEDDPARWVQALAIAVRDAIGMPSFGRTLLGSVPRSGQAAMTTWLAEVARVPQPIVLITDGVDRLPAATRALLVYLLHNLAPNLSVRLGVRAGCDLGLADLLAYGQAALVDKAALQFRLDEVIALVRGRLGADTDADTCAKLHALTEGWPLGVQLALSVAARAEDPRAQLRVLASRRGPLHDPIFDVLVANLVPADADFLTRLSVFDDIHPALAAEVTGQPDAGPRLRALAADTPLIVAGESGEWLRMHAIARDRLRERFQALPEGERTAVHAAAARWYEARAMLEAAARHALAAGQRELAYALAERCLYDGLMRDGRRGAALEWLDQVPAGELDRRPRLLLAIAWALALSDQHRQAEAWVARILAAPGATDGTRCECALILSGAAGFADDPDRFAALHDPWAHAPPLRDALLLTVHANRCAFRAMADGDPAGARRSLQQAPRPQGAAGYLSYWGDYVTGLSYLWEGQVRLAEERLGPALAQAEATLGRRDPLACMLASVLAAAVWERGRPADAAALLADRLDVLEHSGLPETVLLGYRTAARIAAAEGAEHRALDLLEAMHAAGLARTLPRLCVASLAEQIRLHARRERGQTCRDLGARLKALLAGDDLPRGPLWQRSIAVIRELAFAHVALAAGRWREAVAALALAEDAAGRATLGRARLEATALRAWALHRLGEPAEALLREAIDLADVLGLAQLFDDAHPRLGAWASAVRDATPAEAARGARSDAPSPALDTPAPGSEGPGPATEPLASQAAGTAPRAAVPAGPASVLTPKEREVLVLVARGLSNKEIARALQVGPETVKWHMKNLFAKLDAGTRKQCVHRARLLGQLDDATR